ncbi:MAG: hypothetical protein QMB65_10305, partial [Vicingaceae bacterium]
VTITDQANPCTAIDNVTIGEPLLLTASISTSNNVSCQGADNGDATAAGSGGTTAGIYNFLWDVAAGSQTTATATGLAPGTYTVYVTDDNLCIDSVQVTIIDGALIVAGSNDSTSILCNTIGNTLDLNTLLSGNSTTGIWVETTLSGQFNATTGIFNANGLATGIYAFTYYVNGASCPNDSAYFAITINEVENAGNDNIDTLCNTIGTTRDLNTLLSGNSTTGTWIETTSSGQFNATTGVFNAANLNAGVY